MLFLEELPIPTLAAVKLVDYEERGSLHLSLPPIIQQYKQ
jgi:hypothetical protein